MPQNMKYRGSGNCSPSDGVSTPCKVSVSPQKNVSANAHGAWVQRA